MKKSILVISSFLVILSLNLKAQTNSVKAEVLYFKANLACCQAKACNALEGDIRSVVEKLYPSGDVVIKVIRLADPANKALVEKFSAKSQTVVIVSKNKKTEKTVDVSEIIRNYSTNKDRASFETEINNRITEVMK
ncbi:MAG: hypothetical protein ISR55_09615 [Bacteroidetes bacterium]|nr:hypothetical protein [Bacteroidota bacterium]MBL6964072.1 hypothetical protein [Bacteroidota bacterium]